MVQIKIQTLSDSPGLFAARYDCNVACQGFNAAETLADGVFVRTQCLLNNKETLQNNQK